MPCMASHERTIPNVAFDDSDTAVGRGPREILAASPDEVVQNPNLGWMIRHELVGDMRSDESGAARDQDPFILHEATPDPSA